MDVVEAFETLGLSEPGTITAEQLKRAYLRKVRTHPPERDPAGFQLVRQAYDLLQQLGAWQAQQAARSLEATAASSGPSEAEPATGPSPEAVTTTANVTEGASEPSAQPNTAHPFERLRDAYNAHRWTSAANVLLEIYAQASLSTPVPPPQIALQTALELFATSRHKTARRLMEAFKAHMALGGSPLHADVAAGWKLLGELSELSRAVEPTLTTALAESIRSGVFQTAAPELRGELTQHGESQVIALMQARAPTLFAATWPYVPRDPVRRKRRSSVPWGLRVGPFLLFAVARSACGLLDTPSTERPSYSVPAAAIPAPRPATGDRVGDLNVAHEALVADDSTRLHDLTATIEQLYLTGQCDETRNVWGSYVQLVAALGPNDAARQGYAFRRAQASAVCPSLASELPERP
jgi:hypothetical protein